VEFLFQDGEFFFLEMNTRLQVEHPVTELVTGLDLVEWQIRIARGEPLPLRQDEVRLRGHAIEARLCAEDPARGFLPQTGTLLRWEPPAEVRVEHALAPGIAITPAYDSMIAKLIAHGPTRDDARRSLIRALETTVVLGVATNASYLIAALRDPVFVAGKTTTAFVAERAGRDDSVDVGVEGDVALAAVLRCDALARRSGFGAWTAWSASPRPPGIVTLAREPGGEAIAVRVDALDARTFAATIGDARYVVALPAGAPDAGMPSIVVDGDVRVVAYADDGDRLYLSSGGRAASFRDLAAVPATARPSAGGDGALRAPTSGRVLAVSISVGERVVRGAVAVVLEAMKMEHRIVFPHAGTIRTVAVNAGDQVALGDTLVAYDPNPA
jgi:geranyl-CoA carboxylase alpha subunit